MCQREIPDINERCACCICYAQSVRTNSDMNLQAVTTYSLPCQQSWITYIGVQHGKVNQRRGRETND